MIQSEVIEIKNFTKGTRVTNFFGIDHPDFKDLPLGYLIFDALGKPFKIVDNQFDVNNTRLPNNNFKHNPSVKFITGKTSVQTLNYELDENQRGSSRQKFISINQTTFGNQYTFWTEFQNVSVDDMYASVTLIKTYNSLNTLSVINSVEGETVFKESPTGVVFGKLEAIQKINDENGNKIRIPLSNVPVAIFKATDEFPDIASVDDSGNRITLNLKENSSKGQYFNEETYKFAQNFLTSTEQLKNVPDKYRYSALTNEKGEFIIYDVPTGTQTFMMEVDLLKQGMTKDEIALNFFPYPTTESPNVSTIPHLYFQQFAINVVPSWGDFQSGYTQLNISAPLDLRKWATYIFPPVAFAPNEKLEVTVAKNANRKLKIQVRDMTAQNFPIRTLTVSRIDNDLDRDDGSQYVWYNEFAENRRQVEYTEFGCYVLKLPANLYDPNGYKTDDNGFKTLNKGLWLSSYQFKEFIDESLATRTTGSYSYWMNNAFYLVSHFDLNYVAGNDVEHPSYPAPAELGQFPYEKPWSLNYPVPYSVPSKPIIQRFVSGSERIKYSTDRYYMEEPAYEDGDLLGMEVDGVAGGFGIQYVPDPAGDGPGIFFGNRISLVASKNFMYKYESGVAWNETYANGFEPYWTEPTLTRPFAGYSKVNNGEKYQRVECGYGYFMKPQGWPRYVRAPWGADIPTQDIQNGQNSVSSPRITPKGMVGDMYTPKDWFNDIYNIDNQNLSLALGTQNFIKRGGLDIYRIMKSGNENIVKPYNFVIPTYARLKINRAPLAYGVRLRNDGEIPVKLKNRFGAGMYYYDKDSNVKYAERNEIIELHPGKLIFLNGDGEHSSSNVAGMLWGVALTLPGNAAFNTDLNRYTVANYTFNVSYKDAPVNNGSGNYEFYFSVGADTGIPTYWVRTEGEGGDKGVVHDGISRDFDYNGTTYRDKDNKVTNMFFEQYGDDLSEYHGYYK